MILLHESPGGIHPSPQGDPWYWHSAKINGKTSSCDNCAACACEECDGVPPWDGELSHSACFCDLFEECLYNKAVKAMGGGAKLCAGLMFAFVNVETNEVLCRACAQIHEGVKIVKCICDQLRGFERGEGEP